MKTLFYIGRAAQLLGMGLLLEDILTDVGRGPNPKLFYIGIGVFIGGWVLSKFAKR